MQYVPAVPGPRRVCIVGAGPVGSLAAIYFAQRGWWVDLYEARPDMRRPATTTTATANPAQSQRSINLALSVRGLSALHQTGLGLDAEIMDLAIPMRGRMIHDLAGQQTSQVYSVFGYCINSVDRAGLNIKLLDSVEAFGNVRIHFNHALQTCDLDRREATFMNKSTGEHLTVQADLIVGADGSYSTCRRQLMRRTRMDYTQEYITHGYRELTIPPLENEDGSTDFRMNRNHLHIWPRHTFMMIALPNLDQSFTCTLFMPYEKFEEITTEAELVAFFETFFPDALPLMGRDRLCVDFFTNPRGSLMSVKCHPYHYEDKMVIIGDAAHSMVPFYGQGMNCGFEDVEVLFSILDQHDVVAKTTGDGDCDRDGDLAQALAEYTEVRHRDAVAICDLAMVNYIEMRSLVTSRRYLLRKTIEGYLHRWFPRWVVPLYTMVSFSRTPYHRAILQHDRQTRWLGYGWLAVTVMAVTGLACVMRRCKM
ncbi:hypothetical protein BJ085DRAFT_43701 [Dimargaris cristalligena]|uniref:Kynurenine 3-monooxygenase n=1 Tax=Dimargaris cristalligena TaxID=215637 RepID=A0A4Q0A4F4_9FUNG|nr:hypothetical protein BJ085DRAFT_43701 [Dimargaris cristalligena]|eukprot:RKP40140.1 hypothetical protein BJ085DRAFT_43701 [Dimargaris cristalligena]